MTPDEAYEFVDQRRRELSQATGGLAVASLFVTVEQQIGYDPPALIVGHAVTLSAHGRAMHTALKSTRGEWLREKITGNGQAEEIAKAIEIIEASLVMLKEAVQQ